MIEMRIASVLFILQFNQHPGKAVVPHFLEFINKPVQITRDQNKIINSGKRNTLNPNKFQEHSCSLTIISTQNAKYFLETNMELQIQRLLIRQGGLQSFSMNFVYRAFRLYGRFVFKIYYREVEIIGYDLIPQQGPLLLIGNHNNLYLDGTIFISILDRPVSTITAASSWKSNPVLDAGLKMSGAIPISRSWDKIYIGKGTIASVSKGLVVGKDTKFSQYKGGDTLQLKNGQELRITNIEGDELMRVKQEDYQYQEEGPFRILPRLDNSSCFEAVWTALNEDKCISIFPEGYSQDRLELLPFKNGFCVAALGALQRYGKRVTLIPCGLTYENQAKFRSKITIQVGEPIIIDENLAQLYRTNKSLAIKTLFNKVVQEEEQLVFDFRHYDRFQELKVIHAIFSQKYKDKLSPQERMAELRRITNYYSDNLKEGKYQLDDKAKQLLSLSKRTGLQLTSCVVAEQQETLNSALLSSFLLVFTTLLMIPGYLLFFPSMLFILPKAEDYRIQCVRYTKNRIKGYDATASAAIMYSSAVLPFAILISLTLFYFILTYFKWTSHAALICLACFVLQPFYMLLFVKLWDLQQRYSQKLKRYICWTNKKSVLFRLSLVCQQILTQVQSRQSKESQLKPKPLQQNSNIPDSSRQN